MSMKAATSQLRSRPTMFRCNSRLRKTLPQSISRGLERSRPALRFHQLRLALGQMAVTPRVRHAYRGDQCDTAHRAHVPEEARLPDPGTAFSDFLLQQQRKRLTAYVLDLRYHDNVLG